MKIKFLSFIVLILFVFQACGQNTAKSAIGADPQAIAMLKEFYTIYITECDKMPTNEQSMAVLKNKYFTKEFLEKWGKEEMDYDIVLNAQDCDKNWIKTLEVKAVAERKNTYQVCYYYDTFEGKRTTCITLFLVKSNGKYLIDGIENSIKNEQNDISTQSPEIPPHWFGHYTLSMDYGQLDEFSSIFISYDVVIGQDSCIFSGAGYQTYFSDLCSVEADGDELHLIYLNSIEGEDFTNHSGMGSVATLVKDGQRYYIKSPVIADKNWEYNTKILLEKIKE